MTNPIRAEEGHSRNFGQVSTHRSFALLACGAVAGLVLAGYALFTARGTSTLIVPPEDVALVNEQPISRSDYLLQLQTLYDVDLQHATLAQRRKVLDDLIREGTVRAARQGTGCRVHRPRSGAPRWSTRSKWKSRRTRSRRSPAKRSCMPSTRHIGNDIPAKAR